MLCLVPADADAAGRAVLRCYRDDNDVSVVLDRRGGERRRVSRRSMVDGCAEPDRRQVRHADGRRVVDRRGMVVQIDRPDIPRKLRQHAMHLQFVERIAPTAQQLEDDAGTRLLIAAQGGDQSSFTELYTRYFDRLYTYLRVAVKDAHEAEDIAQETFVRFLDMLPRYEVRREQPFRVLLFRMARNRAIDHHRKHGHVACEEPDSMSRRRELGGDQDYSELLNRLSDSDIAVFIKRLPETQRQALVLRYALDFSTEEIAEVMDVSAQAVRNLQHRALRFLRERLECVDAQVGRVSRAAMLIRGRGAPVLNSRRYALAPTFGSSPLAWSHRRPWQR